MLILLIMRIKSAKNALILNDTRDSNEMEKNRMFFCLSLDLNYEFIARARSKTNNEIRKYTIFFYYIDKNIFVNIEKNIIRTFNLLENRGSIDFYIL